MGELNYCVIVYFLFFSFCVVSTFLYLYISLINPRFMENRDLYGDNFMTRRRTEKGGIVFVLTRHSCKI